jgi:hypothetical protein
VIAAAEWLQHSLGHECDECRNVRKSGPRPPRNCLLTLMASAQGDVVVKPTKDKRSLRNEQRRIDKIRKARREQMVTGRKAMLTALMHDVKRSVVELAEASR